MFSLYQGTLFSHCRDSLVIDPDFLELAAHENSDGLRELVQATIDKIDSKDYEAILLGYGLCGNGLAGIRARSKPLVLPRAHDCCTILLGSSSRFLEEFGEDLSAPWSSCGYVEREAEYMRSSEYGKESGFGLEYKELAEKYGEENAAYLWEALHPETDEGLRRFIDLDSSKNLNRADLVRRDAEAAGKEFKIIKGNDRILRSLVYGHWDDSDFLLVKPGEEIKALYDLVRVVEAAPKEGGAFHLS
ncbi:DUF1638 domain-containing protein [Treponema sp.]